MKVKIVPTIIAFAIAVLIGLLVRSWCSSTNNATAIGVTTALSLALTLIPCMGLKLESGRLQVNVRVLSIIFVFIFLVVAVIMCFVKSDTITTYYIIEGIIALIFISILYGLTKIKDVRHIKTIHKR